MPRSALAIVIAVFLLLAGLYNFGAGLAQFGKAELVSGTTSALASMGESVAAASRNKPWVKGGDAKLQSDSQGLRAMGARSSTLMYLIALGIVLAAVLQLVAGVGVIARSDWAPRVLMLAGVAGVLVEIQDLVEDGFGAGQLSFLVVAVGAIYLSIQMKAAASRHGQAKAHAAVGGPTRS